MSGTLATPQNRTQFRIHRLTDEVINQIAAGEVVDRPASALKELIENSLDAGATRIEVHLEEGGLSLISVIDNGFGIGIDDLPLAIERHATSKLTTAEDLESILSFGFRGEALSSISAVSEIEIRTRPKDSDTGTVMKVDFGTCRDIRPIGCSFGTQVSVRNLFGRIPARLKFLRTSATECSHCLRVVRELALGNPPMSYFVHHNGKAVAKYTSASRLERVQEVMRPTWQPLTFQDSFEDMRFEAFLSPPEYLQDRGELYLFVNGRSVKNRLILSSIRNSYAEVFGPHHEPSGAFYLDMRTDWVDVNVHPQKLDVRFFRQERIYGWILATLRKQLQKLKPLSVTMNASTSTRPAQTQMFSGAHQTAELAGTKPLSSTRFLSETSTGLYLFETPEGIWFLSRHGLLELRNRIELKSQLAEGRLSTRTLELPLLLSLKENLFAQVSELLALLNNIGIHCEVYGDRDIAVKTLPVRLPDDAFLLVVEEWVTQSKAQSPTLETFCATLACVQATLPTESLPINEIFQITTGLLLSVHDANCPKGSPAPFHLEWANLRKHFNTL